MPKIVVLPLLMLGIAGCVSEAGYYERPRGYYGAPSYGYGYGGPPGGYYSSGYGGGGQCTFHTRRGPMMGYQPPGKNRCCIDTRQGPSCQ